MFIRSHAPQAKLWALALTALLAACTQQETPPPSPPGGASNLGLAQTAPAGSGEGAANPNAGAAMAVASTGGSASLPAPADSGSAAAINQAQSLRKQGKPADAAELLRKELESHPEDIMLNREFQDAMRAAGKTAEARELYAQRAKTFPGSAVAQYLYGRSVIQENSQEAEAAFKKAIQLDPGLLWPYLGLGTVHSNAQDFFAAVQTYEEALKHFSNSAELYFNLANTYRDIGALPKAADAAAKAIQLRPDFAAAYTIAGRCAFEQQDFDAARTSLEKGLNLDPQMPDANLFLAQVYARKGDLEKAREYAGRAAKLGQSIPDDLKAQLKQP